MLDRFLTCSMKSLKKVKINEKVSTGGLNLNIFFFKGGYFT